MGKDRITPHFVPGGQTLRSRPLRSKTFGSKKIQWPLRSSQRTIRFQRWPLRSKQYFSLAESCQGGHYVPSICFHRAIRFQCWPLRSKKDFSWPLRFRPFGSKVILFQKHYLPLTPKVGLLLHGIELPYAFIN